MPHNVQQYIVMQLFSFDKTRDVATVAVHREYRFADYHHALIAGGMFFEYTAEVFVVIMAVTFKV